MEFVSPFRWNKLSSWHLLHIAYVNKNNMNIQRLIQRPESRSLATQVCVAWSFYRINDM